ncbi:MAG: hypothetical protein JWQ81_1883 [Amycolatopsis sp.]|jgi:uncharacterized protein (TIGR02246 family)|uniref:SgcJ/EcaC family oxidoreductase n=1 Tax=Amycolatopsis sp. TaxID=37632 RepID=UPI0026039A3E|nr:SgcJ/EcaC family oxidoreductase [Amycolatopsis sp.]MCU1681144.1 hypothetical protein [Amycolatopsis sp.]
MVDQAAEVLVPLGKMAQAWNDGDATAYANLFTEDADYVTFFGMNMPGRAAIEASHRALFEGLLKGSKLIGSDVQPKVRFLRPDVAVVVAGGGGSSLDGGSVVTAGRESTQTYVLVNNGEGWQIASFQNTRVSDPRAAS